MTDGTFVSDLRWALNHLYDPERLRTSPLMERFGISPHDNPSELRRILTSAIRALAPEPSAATDSTAWRTHYTLYHRYVDQFSQRQVAMSLGLSVRQMRRQDRLALQVLAEHLESHYHLMAVAPKEGASQEEPGGQAAMKAAEASGAERELAWVQQSYPSQAVDVAELIGSLIKVIGPLAQARHVRVKSAVPEDLPRVAVQPAPMRQAVLSVLTRAIECAPGGLVKVSAEAKGRKISIGIHPSRHAGTGTQLGADRSADFEVAQQLLVLSSGSLQVLPGRDPVCPFIAMLSLPTVEQATVLFIDDNADTLQLFRRYLAGTRYPFVGVRDPDQAIALAEELAPRIIVLDVMLPRIDGWELLGRLRQHPNTHGVPIIVCSILKEEHLAVALGAAAFLAKPVSQMALIEALDAQLGPGSPECQ